MAEEKQKYSREIDFINKRYLFMVISCILFILTILVLIFKGLNLGLDFTGGTLLQIVINKDIPIGEFRKILANQGISGFSLQNVYTSDKLKKEYIIRVKSIKQEGQEVKNKIEEILNSLSTSEQKVEYEILRSEYVGPVIGKYLTQKALYAIIFSLVGIIIYVGIRFKSSIWGVAGVIALIHDVVLTLGFLTLLNKEITISVIAALLTLAGYSINDTIIIFDRIRENLSLLRKETLDKIMNYSINQILIRTVLTSATTFIAVLSLYILGNEIIKDFALSLLFGIIVGTYSSIYIASAIVLEYNRLTKK